MKEFWSKRIRDMVPYVPGEQPKGEGLIKLNTNECPYPPASGVAQAIGAAAGEALRLYPDPECTQLREAIARREGLRPGQVFCSNGSDEVLAFAFQAFFDPDRDIVFPRITYSFYPVYTDFFGLKRREVPMEPDFRCLPEGLCGDNGGVVLANPNAPTGIGVGLDVVEQILQANREVVVIVDEAYVDFGGQSAVPLIDRYPNLLVVRTASKSRALAGLRVGWAMGQEHLIQGLRCVRDSINSYTVDRLAMAGLAASLEDEPYFRSVCQRVIDTRAWVGRELEELGFRVLPSQANFLFVSHPERDGRALHQGLRERGILVRRWEQELIAQWLRISIGTDEEMRALIRAVKELI